MGLQFLNEQGPLGEEFFPGPGAEIRAGGIDHFGQDDLHLLESGAQVGGGEGARNGVVGEGVNQVGVALEVDPSNDAD